MSTGAPGNGSVPGITLDWASADVRRVLSRSEEHTSELQSQSNLVCRLLLEKKKKHNHSRLHTSPKVDNEQRMLLSANKPSLIVLDEHDESYLYCDAGRQDKHH